MSLGIKTGDSRRSSDDGCGTCWRERPFPVHPAGAYLTDTQRKRQPRKAERISEEWPGFGAEPRGLVVRQLAGRPGRCRPEVASRPGPGRRGPLLRVTRGRATVAAYPEVVQRILDVFLAVAAVGGDGARPAAGAADDPLDGRDQLWGVGWVALVHAVVEHDTIVVVEDLTFVAELDRFTEASLGDRPGVGFVQATR
jgi:hypothetical protein